MPADKWSFRAWVFRPFAFLAEAFAGESGTTPGTGEPLCIHALTVEAVQSVSLSVDAVRTLSLAAESVRTVSISVEICDMSNFIKPGTAVTISLEVRTKSTNALINATTLDVTVTLPDGTEIDYAITDLTNSATGVYSKVYRVPDDCDAGEITVEAQVNDSDDLTAVFNDYSFTVIARRLAG